MPMNLSAMPQLPTTLTADEACSVFIAAAQLMLDPATAEARRMQAEPQLLAQLPVLRALGVLDLFVLRDPTLRALIEDELAELHAPSARCRQRC